MTDIWVCANCRSVNNQRAKQCYQCRTPKERAAVDPSTISSTNRGQVRQVELPTFHPSYAFGLVASVFIIGFVALEVVRTLIASAVLTQVVDASQPVPVSDETIVALGIAALGVGLLALVTWSLWLSRAVQAMPALGLGYPAANGLMAFVENFIPGLNLLRVPAIVRDIVHRLEPNPGRGDALIFAAWIGLFGGLVIPRVGSFLLIGAETPQQLARSAVVIASVSIGLVVTGAAFLVALIWWIEARISRRRRAQLAEPAAGTTTPLPDEVAHPEPMTPPPAPVAPPASMTSPAPVASVAPPTATLKVTPTLPVTPSPRPPEAHDRPQLTLIVGADGTILAELDDQVEPVTLDDIPELAAPLARAGASAVVTPRGAGADVLRVARKAVAALRANGVPTDFVD